jgi:hypothetical protein
MASTTLIQRALNGKKKRTPVENQPQTDLEAATNLEKKAQGRNK